MSRGSLKRTNANVKTGPRLVQSGIINFGDFEVKHSVTSWLTGKSEVTGKIDDLVKEDLSKWTEIEITCIGNHLVHKINGKVTVDITDDDEKNREFEGVLALQIHAGGPMTIEFKDLQLKHIVKKK